MTRKTKRLIVGDRIMILAPPRKRAPVRVDRSVPVTWEEYEQQRDERRLEAERSELFEAMRSAPGGEGDTPAITDVDRNSNSNHDVECSDNATPDGEEQP